MFSPEDKERYRKSLIPMNLEALEAERKTCYQESREYSNIWTTVLAIRDYRQDNKEHINKLVERFLDVTGRGNWISHKFKTCKKTEILGNLKVILVSMLNKNTERVMLIEEEIKNKKSKINPMQNVLNAIHNDEAELIGTGEWVKDSAYQVYKYEGKFYSIIVADSMSWWLMDETLEEINESEVEKYV